MAATLDEAFDELIRRSRTGAPARGIRPARWPMIVLASPKGWTGPKEVDGKPVEGFWRSHQVPIPVFAHKPEHLELLETWMRLSPRGAVRRAGLPSACSRQLAPEGERRMSANPHTNGGLLLRDLQHARLPRLRRRRPDRGRYEPRRRAFSEGSCAT